MDTGSPDFTPRSARSYASNTPRSYQSPRTDVDDRFFTPRTFNNSSDNDEKDSRFDTARERITPRGHGSFNSLSSTSPNPTPRQYGTPRQQFESPRQGSESEYITPRTERISTEYKTNEISMMRQGYGMMHSNRGEEKSPNIYRNEDKYGYYNSQSNNNNNNNYYNDNKDQGYNSNFQSRDTNYSSFSKPPLPRGYDNPYPNRSNTIHEIQENTETEEYTLGYGVSENDVEELFSYARHGRIIEIERSLDKGIPIDVRDPHGNTLLIIACQNGNKRVAKLLLRRGANINGRNHKGIYHIYYHSLSLPL